MFYKILILLIKVQYVVLMHFSGYILKAFIYIGTFITKCNKNLCA